MLLHIESYYGDHLLSGKSRPERQLRRMCKWVYHHFSAEQFARAFCQLYNFEDYTAVADADLMAGYDYWFDLDSGFFDRATIETLNNFQVEAKGGKWAVFDKTGNNITGYIFDSARDASEVFE